MKYIVYLTTNLKNGKIYVGVYSTLTPHKFDGYIGNGVYIPKAKPDFKIEKPNTPFKKAVNKYGAENFIRAVISIFQEESEAYDLESLLITKEFIKSKHTYNTKLGGYSSSTTIKVNQYSIDGKYIKTWNSLTNAAEYFSISPSCLLESCTNELITSAGHIWRYHRNYKNDIRDIIIKNRVPGDEGNVNARRVIQYSNQGYRKKTFKSIAVAAKHFNISYQSVEQCCNLNIDNRSTGGYQWRFESDRLDSLPPLNSKITAKEVEQVHKNIVVNTYKSSNQAAKEIGFSKGGRSIRKACISNKKYKGYHWRYKG